jgi:hypothetical protein
MKNTFKVFGAMRGIAIIVLVAVIGFSMAACPADGGNSGSSGDSDVGTFLDGTWTATGPNRNFVLNGNTWVYSETTPNYSKGTWKSSVKPAAGVTTTLTLTLTHVTNGSGGWTNRPSSLDSVKENTASCVINDAGTQMTISNPALTTASVWGTLAGTYTKQP